ncbi:SLBB domain-containing protein [bacterium]|nr:SLBB domain-containing protein [bacterium]
MKSKFIITMLLSMLCSTSLVFAVDNTVLKDKNISTQKALNLKNLNLKNSYMEMDSQLDEAVLDKMQTTTQEKPKKLSAIEKLFNPKDVELEEESILRQVGYDLFTSPAGLKGNTTGKFNPSYKLSVGEKVNIYLYGDSVDVMAISGSSLISPVVVSQVDSNGNIFIQGLGVVSAENRTMAEVEREINKLANQKYKNMKVKLNIASSQEFSVFVYGQVNKPGKVFVGNNSSLMDALSAAGGVKNTGSLRKVSYTSGNKTQEVDLYKTIFSGEDEDIILRPNDKIFITGIGSVVAIKNGVSLPGIYEINEGESLEQLITYAGGTLPSTQEREVVLTTLDKDSQERQAKNIAWKEIENINLTNGDSIEFRELYNVAENIVVLQGNVKHPGTFAYKPDMRLSDVLKDKKELLEETFATQAVIRRIKADENEVETIPVFLKEFFAGINDPVLQPRDVINVYKNTNSDFVEVYGCINNPKQIVYKKGMRLDSVLVDTQFIKTTIDENELDVAYKDSEVDKLFKVGATKNSESFSAEDVAVEIISADEEVQVYYLYDILVNSNTIKSIVLNPGDKVFFRPLRDTEMIKNVRISGFVKHPRTYRFVDGKRLIDIINESGGLTKDADLRGIVYIRKNLQMKQVDLAKKNNEKDIKLLEGRLAGGFKQASQDIQAKADMINMLRLDQLNLGDKYSGQIALDIKDNDLSKISEADNLEVQDGDEIYIPRMSKHVSVIGEVYNEQAFAFRKGMTAGDYIKEVGGYTPNASKFRLYKVGVNGRAEKIKRYSKIAAGDTIVVPRKIAGNDWITPVCETLRGLASIISTAFIVTKI